MANSMNQIVIRFVGRHNKNDAKNTIINPLKYNPQKVRLPVFLNIEHQKLSEFEYKVQQTLKRIYTNNSAKNLLYQRFPKREIPSVIDLTTPPLKNGWIAMFSRKKNKITISDNQDTDLLIPLIHELKHMEEQFNDSALNNYQKHQAYVLLEASAKVFQCQYLGRGAYYQLSLEEALKKWICEHYYPHYKIHYDKQWPIHKGSKGLIRIPHTFGITDRKQKKTILNILNQYITN